MINRLETLPAKEQRGSRARCILFTDGSKEEVAQRFSALVAPHGIVDPSHHSWAPHGFAQPGEAKLGETANFLSKVQRDDLLNWWLAARHPQANVPNWDLVSQATINGREGLILVEAKAHEAELDPAGKRVDEDASDRSTANHNGIANRISEASEALASSTGLNWKLSRDSHYQMSNRFAWAWKLTAMGIPVILIYLGFLNAAEMQDRGAPFKNHDQWRSLAMSHSEPLFPTAVWEGSWKINGVDLIPLIRSMTVPLR